MNTIELEARYDWHLTLVEVPIMILGFRMGYRLIWKDVLVEIQKNDPRFKNAPLGGRMVMHPEAFTATIPKDGRPVSAKR